MSEFWNQWVIILISLTLFVCYGLVWWFSKINSEDNWNDDNHIGYQRWGEIRASNYPVPNFWSALFYLSAIGAGIYLTLYPGIRKFSREITLERHASI